MNYGILFVAESEDSRRAEGSYAVYRLNKPGPGCLPLRHFDTVQEAAVYAAEYAKTIDPNARLVDRPEEWTVFRTEQGYVIQTIPISVWLFHLL